MNIPSHYQSAFFKELNAHEHIDLLVIYLNDAAIERAEEGWNSSHEYQSYERSASGQSMPDHIDSVVPDWSARIHIIGGRFSPSLVEHFCTSGVSWCHWSEMPGIRLAELLGYQTPLFRLLNPLMLAGKRSEGVRIRNHALGAFGQGYLARRAFRLMGVPEDRISDLYYVPAPLEPLRPSEQVVQFAAGRNVFLSVGALCRRKGIDVLLRSFARLKTDDWCLVLCGLDRSDGAYQALANKLGVSSRVLFLGAHPAERIAEVYAASDVFVLASRFDGWGAVLNEAASMALPLIGTDLCGGSWHLIDPGVNGFRVRAGSVADLTKALDSYVAHAGLLQQHGNESKKRYFNGFTPESNATRLVDSLESWSSR